MDFDPSILKPADRKLAESFIPDRLTQPDLVIAPEGKPYLYRWFIVPRNEKANVYFHIQVGDDPERPLHDHPWDNTSVILAGGYTELMSMSFAGKVNPDDVERWCRRKGDVVHRKAETAHRLLLLPKIAYTMTLFTTGPQVRTWGFWFKDGWRPYTDVIENLTDGRSIFKEPTT